MPESSRQQELRKLVESGKARASVSPFGADEFFLNPGASFKVSVPRGMTAEAVTNPNDQYSVFAPGITEMNSPVTLSHERIHQLQGGVRRGIPRYGSIPYERVEQDPSLGWVGQAMETNTSVPFLPETLKTTMEETGAYRFSDRPRNVDEIARTPGELESWMRLMRQYTPVGESPAEEAAYNPVLMKLYLRNYGIPNPPRIRSADEINRFMRYNPEAKK